MFILFAFDELGPKILEILAVWLSKKILKRIFGTMKLGPKVWTLNQCHAFCSHF